MPYIIGNFLFGTTHLTTLISGSTNWQSDSSLLVIGIFSLSFINLSSIYHRLSFTSIEIFIISSSSLMKFNSLFQFITYTYHLNTNFIKISSNFTEISTNHRLISMITWSTRWWKHFKTHTFCCMKQQLKNGQNERIYRKTNWYIHRSNWHSEFLSKWWTFIVIWINIL